MRHNSSPFARQTPVQIFQIRVTKVYLIVYGGFLVAQLVENLPAMLETGFDC